MHREDLLYLSKSAPQVRTSIKRILPTPAACARAAMAEPLALLPVATVQPSLRRRARNQRAAGHTTEHDAIILDPTVPRPRYSALPAIPALRSRMLGPLDRDELRVQVRLLRRGAALETTAHPAAPRNDTDPQRLAVLATLVEALVEAFNWSLDLSLRRDRCCDTTSAFGSCTREDFAAAAKCEVDPHISM
jgi:hypothetical protein